MTYIIRESTNLDIQSKCQIHHSIYDNGIFIFCIRIGTANTELIYGGEYYDKKHREDLLKKFEQSSSKDTFNFPDSNVYVSKQGSQISICDDGKGLRPRSVTTIHLEEQAIKMIFTNIEKFCIDYKKELDNLFYPLYRTE